MQYKPELCRQVLWWTQLEKEGVLLPTTSPRNSTSHELAIFCHQIEEDIISNNIDTGRIRFSHRSNGEGGRRQP